MTVDDVLKWLKAFHILAVIAWMAGLMYLPRLFAYHTEAAGGSEMDLTFQKMERGLFKIIMRHAMIAAWLLGLALIYVNGELIRGWAFLLTPWMIVKLAGVVFLTAWNHFLGEALKAFAAGRNTRSQRFWRMVNELPFVAAIFMVIAVMTEFGS